MVLKIHYGENSGIVNYGYERYCGKTSGDEFTLDSAVEGEQEIEDSIEELVLMLNEREKTTESSDEDQLVDKKFSHLNMRDA